MPEELRSDQESIILEADFQAAVRLLPWDRDHRLVERYRHGELVSFEIVPV